MNILITIKIRQNPLCFFLVCSNMKRNDLRDRGYMDPFGLALGFRLGAEKRCVKTEALDASVLL